MATVVPVAADVAPAVEPTGAAAPTPVANALAVLLPTSYVATTLAPHAVLAHLAMVPVHTFLTKRHLWNVATHAIVEPSLPLTVCNVAVVLAYARTIESDWGTAAFSLYLLFTSAVVGITMLFASPALSAAFNAPYAASAFCGFLPCAIAIAIANWQRSPTAPVPGISALRASHLPLTLVAVAGLIELIAGPGIPEDEDVTAGATPLATWTLPAFVGLVAAWFYLRFLRNRGSGDPSAAMALDGLFPGPLRVLARAAGRVAFPLVRCCGLGEAIAQAEVQAAKAAAARPQSQRDDDLGGGAVDLPGSAPSVADRRRQIALQALAERLQRARQDGARKAAVPTAGATAETSSNGHEVADGRKSPASVAPTTTANADFGSPEVAPVAGRAAGPREAVDF